MRQLLRRLCAAAFTEIYECADGVAAVEAFVRQRPDWVLLDIAMPDGDGLTATARILASQPSARVIIVSEHDGASFRNAAARAGAFAFVSKQDLTPLRRLFQLWVAEIRSGREMIDWQGFSSNVSPSCWPFFGSF